MVSYHFITLLLGVFSYLRNLVSGMTDPSVSLLVAEPVSLCTWQEVVSGLLVLLPTLLLICSESSNQPFLIPAVFKDRFSHYYSVKMLFTIVNFFFHLCASHAQPQLSQHSSNKQSTTQLLQLCLVLHTNQSLWHQASCFSCLFILHCANRHFAFISSSLLSVSAHWVQH